MGSLIEYWKSQWRKRFKIEASDLYPARDDHQKNYRKEFGDIVDQYLIFYKNEERNGHHYKSIVFIDSEDDVDWIDDSDHLSDEEMKKRNQYISKLDVVHSLPVQNLSKNEIINFKKLLGVGYAAALYQNWDEVDMAIAEAKKYRDDRNKERSRYLLLKAATIFLVIIVGLYLAFVHCMMAHPHFNMFTGMVMGAIGAYVSIWMRYGKLDMTGLGMSKLHYLEAFSRITIGVIFAMIITLALKSGIVLNSISMEEYRIYVYCVLGFCAGFSEQFVPSILESFMNKSKNE